ncbi:MAG: hypothetical protein HQL18_03565, partial [Candidatus Omnitrophica bacterium]|nr:hypothetical protein [Candidatus Omnitrophota bacterium]
GPRDIVIIDEAHLGTDYKDLCSLTAVLMQDLIKTGAVIIYATHLKQVMHILAHDFAEVQAQQIVLEKMYDYYGKDVRRLVEGIAENSYAIDTLKRCGFPEEFIRWVRIIYDALRKGETVPSDAVPMDVEKIRRNLNPKVDRSDTEGDNDVVFGKVAAGLFPARNFCREYSPQQLSSVDQAETEKWLAVDSRTLIAWRERLFQEMDLDAIRRQSNPRLLTEYCAVLRRYKTAVDDELRARVAVLKAMEERNLAVRNYREKMEILLGKIEEFRADFSDEELKEANADEKNGAALLFWGRHSAIQGICRAMRYDSSYDDLNKIDLMVGMALCTRENTLQPVARANNGYAVENFRSPLMPGAVPLNFRSDAPHPQFIITGPNKSGKTTFLRALQVIELLDRLNLPVPGTVKKPRYERQFTYFGVRESMEKGRSYFRRVGGRLIAFMQGASAGSLGILDELQGSDYWELSAVQAALILYLNRLGVTTFLVTHMREGLRVVRPLLSVTFLKTGVERKPDGELVFDRIVSEDPNLQSQSYGVESVRNHLSDDQFRRALAIREEMVREEALPQVERQGACSAPGPDPVLLPASQDLAEDLGVAPEEITEARCGRVNGGRTPRGTSPV